MFDRKKYYHEYNKNYYEKNKEKILAKGREHYKANKDYMREYGYRQQIENIKSWEDYFPKKTNCQICGKDIFFNLGSRKKTKENEKESICFDHKQENTLIKLPSQWLKGNRRTLEKEKKWEMCGFGKLCNRCNKGLPTKNRNQFVKNLYNYVFGQEV